MKYQILSVLGAFAVGTSVASADYSLTILHTNDIHSRIESINRFDSTCDAEGEAEGKCFGGIARIKTKMDELRTQLGNQNVLVLDAGDPFQGSLFYTTYKGEAEAKFMEVIGYDAMAVGNHEFDDGPEGLSKFIDAVSFPVVSGNIDVSAEDSLAGKVEDHLILEVGGEKIGIISALATDTVDTSSPGDNVTFQDEIEALKADVAELEAAGVSMIIALNMAAQIAEMGAPIEEMKKRVVAKTSDVVNGDRAVCRVTECPMGNLVADAMLDRVKDQGVTIAIQNGGGLRASIDGGEVTMGEVLSVLPFQNTLATFQVSGQTIIDALENGVSQVEEVKGRFPQVAGLKFTWDASVAPNEGRIQEVMVMDGDSYSPIDPAATYSVVSNNYVRNGGDGYKMFRD